MFFRKREAEKKKKEDKLADAKEWLKNTKKITKKATSKNKGDLTDFVTYHEELVA